jgi:NAD(P)H-hydrate epimerase
VLSLDLPSGVDATSGDTPGVHVRADRTLTLALPKTGLVASAAGSLLLADLGIPLATYRKAGVTLDSSPFRA